MCICYYQSGFINDNQDQLFIIVKPYKCLQMKATLLAALSIGTMTKSFLRENKVFLTSCSLKILLNT